MFYLVDEMVLSLCALQLMEAQYWLARHVLMLSVHVRVRRDRMPRRPGIEVSPSTRRSWWRPYTYGKRHEENRQ